MIIIDQHSSCTQSTKIFNKILADQVQKRDKRQYITPRLTQECKTGLTFKIIIQFTIVTE